MSHALAPRRNSVAVVTGLANRRSPFALIGALLLHAALIGATLFTFAHTLDITDVSPPVVPVDLVTIADKTNIAPTVQRQMKYHEQEITQPAPSPMQVQTPVVPQEQQAEAAPDTAPSEPVVKPVPAPPQPQLKPQTQVKPDQPKKKADDQFAALLNKLTSQQNAPANARVADRTVRGVGAMNAMTMDIQDALRNQIAQCWSPPVGAPDPQDLVVDFDLFLNPDGSVARPPQLLASSGNAASNPYSRAAAEAARRAIYECAPYKLPADKYSVWREIDPFHFDPRQMMGQ
ncbi:MAG TPA: hypothetical protein VHW02_05840 [Rhizomicrobium sp.]|jgi:outer membrane biosynthesis protein TonB|nr:hypothetical protein [Rhizomicrobium sp.]